MTIDLETGIVPTLRERYATRIPDHILVADGHSLTVRERERIEMCLRNLDRILDSWQHATRHADIVRGMTPGVGAALDAALKHRRAVTVHADALIQPRPAATTSEKSNS